jgi:hypothetical protein
VEGDGRVALQSFILVAAMPHKHNADRRHHIPKMSFKVQNWPAYEAGLRRRGSLTAPMVLLHPCAAGAVG